MAGLLKDYVEYDIIDMLDILIETYRKGSKMLKRHRIGKVLSLAIIFLIAMSCILTGCSSVGEEEAKRLESIPLPTPEAGIFVYDQDDLFEDDFESEINAMLVDLEKKTEVEFVVLTVESLIELDIEDYAANVFNTLGIGKKESDNGILLIMSRSDTRVRLEIGYGLEDTLTDSKCGELLDEFFVPNRDEDDYLTATSHTVQSVINVLSKKYDVKIDNVDESIKETDNTWLLIIVLVIILAIVILCSIFGSSDSGSGGGFFTSSSGGGSSGGFGGGGSGGGGASR